ncbi:hypothetical protein TNCV_4855731 [Trichonephila clavipes]|nr:hypothetical protein TNCV_4855731 [Trichonephila clavipes]
MISSFHDRTGLAIETSSYPHAFTRLGSRVDFMSLDSVGLGCEQIVYASVPDHLFYEELTTRDWELDLQDVTGNGTSYAIPARRFNEVGLFCPKPTGCDIVSRIMTNDRKLHIFQGGSVTPLSYVEDVFKPQFRQFSGAFSAEFLLMDNNAWPL